jgi:hypothetical protein
MRSLITAQAAQQGLGAAIATNIAKLPELLRQQNF